MRMPEGGLQETKLKNKNTTKNKQACKDCVEWNGFQTTYGKQMSWFSQETEDIWLP